MEVMHREGFSQLPVVSGKFVIGVFSYESFARFGKGFADKKQNPYVSPVDELLDEPVYIASFDELDKLLELLASNDSALVGNPNMLQGVLTAADVMAYLYQISNAFFVLEEIELALRHLIALAMDTQELAVKIPQALREAGWRHETDPPSRLDDLTIGQLVDVVGYGPNWPDLRAVLGPNRQMVTARLKPIPKIRNDVFHFRRELSIREHETLVQCRKWLHKRSRVIEGRQSEDQDER